MLQDIIKSSVSLTLDPKSAEENLINYLKAHNIREEIEIELEKRKETKQFIALWEEEDWTVKKVKNGITGSIRELKGHSAWMVKTEARIKCSMRKMYEVIHTQQFEDHNPLIVSLEAVQKYDENHIDWYLKTTAGFPWTERDWLYTRWDIYGPEKSLTIAYSIDRPDRPITKKYVRGIVLASGTVIIKDKEDPEYVRVIALHHTDLGGHMPIWMANMGWRAAMKSLTHLKNVLESQKE